MLCKHLQAFGRCRDLRLMLEQRSKGRTWPKMTGRRTRHRELTEYPWKGRVMVFVCFPSFPPGSQNLYRMEDHLGSSDQAVADPWCCYLKLSLRILFLQVRHLENPSVHLGSAEWFGQSAREVCSCLAVAVCRSLRMLFVEVMQMR